MKNHIIFALFILFLFTSLFFVTRSVFAVLGGDDPSDRMLEDPGLNDGTSKTIIEQSKKKQVTDTKNFLYNFLDSLYATPMPTESPAQPTIVPSGGLLPTSAPYTGNFVSYRQCNYRSTNLRDGCNICSMGCGITSAAMIASSLLKNTTLTPPTVLQKYTALGQGSGCYGSSIMSAKTVLESYGLKTSEYVFRSFGEPIANVADDIRPYVKNGSVVFVLAYFCNAGTGADGETTGGCGHFFVVTDIDENNRVTSFDPYYEPPVNSAQPIHYEGRAPTFPRYRAAFAVQIP